MAFIIKVGKKEGGISGRYKYGRIIL